MISVTEFTTQSLARQMGALAANLARVSSCARWTTPTDVIVPMLLESIQFIEWIAPQAEPKVAAELVDLQVMLGLWRKGWAQAKTDRAQSVLLSLQAKKWSDQILDFSGLLIATT
jgi:hypothetical protein